MNDRPTGSDALRSDVPVPRATYRLQLNKDFTFAHAEAIADYLGRLGISHAYLSPILKARPGSTHGYDTVDHTLINPELGTIEDFRRMAAAFREQGIGIILDIVPNHMGIGGEENPYWLDVLEWGHDSRYADWFDINWAPSEPSLHNKVLVPFLGSSYGAALEGGRLELRFDREAGSFAVWAEGTHKLPLDPRSYGEILEHCSEELRQIGSAFEVLSEPAGARELKMRLASGALAEEIEGVVATFNGQQGRRDLATLIERQNWRAARYSVASDDINYRRFFIVSDLAAIRIEKREVFDHAHRLVFQLVEEGWVEGLRIDHIDGLFDPKRYALELRERCPRPIYLVVEKILAPHEQLRQDWSVDGTTGYEFANAATRLLVDRSSEAALTALYTSFTGSTKSLAEIELSAKFDIIDYEMAAELDALVARLREIATANRNTADLTYNALRNGLRHFVAAMGVYRTYVDGSAIVEEDRRNVVVAMAHARNTAPFLDPAVFDFLAAIATGDLDPAVGYDPQAVLEVAQRLQQYTGPVMAKGLEDTALYRYNRLIALSDVGEKPDRFGSSVAAFHDFNSARQRTVPLGMLTTSSHDTKRGEDVRARIAAISLFPAEWEAAVTRWRSLLAEEGAPEIDPNEMYYLLQQLLGAWPAEFAPDRDLDETALGVFRDRSVAAMTKAIRESRLHTSWTANNESYEQNVATTIERALDPRGRFLAEFRAFEEKVGLAGARNGLIETVLKLTVPGMPDIYQGAELWEQSMVDPDNRRPVDFELRRKFLNQFSGDLAALMPTWRDGAIKLALVQRLLGLRRDLPRLFAGGSYEPLEITGDHTERSLAFVRREGSDAVLVAAWLGRDSEVPDARLGLSPDFAGAGWQNVLGGTSKTDATLAALLGDLPVAVLCKG
jgi:(1->4)-alpha-D-glucan 1-alpha-D-glucosylmutase